jgi:hypothetical protein
MQELLQLGQLVYIISSSADNVKFVFSFLGQKFRPENIVSNASEITVQQLCKPWLLEGCWSNEAQLSLPIVLSSLGFGKKLMYI